MGKREEVSPRPLSERREEEGKGGGGVKEKGWPLDEVCGEAGWGEAGGVWESGGRGGGGGGGSATSDSGSLVRAKG